MPIWGIRTAVTKTSSTVDNTDWNMTNNQTKSLHVYVWSLVSAAKSRGHVPMSPCQPCDRHPWVQCLQIKKLLYVSVCVVWRYVYHCITCKLNEVSLKAC